MGVLTEYQGFDANAPPETLGWAQLRKVAELLGLDTKNIDTPFPYFDVQNRPKIEKAIREAKLTQGE